MSVDPNANSVSQNMHAWSNLTDYIWVDQPVYAFLSLIFGCSTNFVLSGVGYSTSDASGYGMSSSAVCERVY